MWYAILTQGNPLFPPYKDSVLLLKNISFITLKFTVTHIKARTKSGISYLYSN